jgi:hypothetical protein
MKFITAILFACLLLAAGQAQAGQAEVRDVAIANNCPPKKIEIYTQALGGDGAIVYRVQCTMPKTVGAADSSAKPADALLVSCKQSLCEMLRPVASDAK